MTGQEAHEKSKEMLIVLNDLYHALPDKKTICAEDLRAIDLNADQIQCIAEDIQFFIRNGERKTRIIEPQ